MWENLNRSEYRRLKSRGGERRTVDEGLDSARVKEVLRLHRDRRLEGFRCQLLDTGACLTGGFPRSRRTACGLARLMGFSYMGRLASRETGDQRPEGVLVQ